MKTISEVFTLEVSTNFKVHITARNYNSNLICFNGEPDHQVNSDDLRKIADFLIETANKIDLDNDFKNIK